MKKQKLVAGFGINDVKDCEKHIKCLWKNIFTRAYRDCYQKNQLSYIDCSVDPSWHKLSDFRAWFLSSNYKPGLALDKDIINRGNKIYGPDHCSFVSRRINNVVLDRNASRGQYKVGVSFNNSANKFVAYCGIDAKRVHLGTFLNEEAAFQAYKSFKEANIKVVAEEEYQLGNCTKEVRDALLGWTI